MKEELKTLLNQIGGRQTLFMLGAKEMLYSNKESYVQFKISGSKEYTHVRVQYDEGSDLNNIRFFKLRAGKVLREKEINGLFSDQLRGAIERNTGLRTSMTKVYA